MKLQPIVQPIQWRHQTLFLLDQTALPGGYRYRRYKRYRPVGDAIKTMIVRGAPAIGCTAAYAMALAAYQWKHVLSRDQFLKNMNTAAEYLIATRPTAVNLAWAVHRILNYISTLSDYSTKMLAQAVEAEAVKIFDEDMAMGAAIGRAGMKLIKKGYGILTHCNAGGLATSGFGTALAPMYFAHAKGVSFKVYADETRPLLQGARLTAWELQTAGIDVTTITDNMAAKLMAEKKINLIIVGADRIAANGDTANKIGTYSVAVLAQYHRIPLYVAAPSSTIDGTLKNGDAIPIEERHPDEVRKFSGRFTAPKNVAVYNPAFDVTPAKLIHGIITEKGIVYAPYRTSLKRCLYKKKH